MAAALALSLVLATAAHAQLDDPGEDTLDTDVTPVAKESERWQRVAGAKYSSNGPKPSDVPEGSVTSFEADLFTVSFHDPRNGLAGGAVCREPVPEGASPADARQHTASCERVPVIYRYSVNDLEEASWEEVYRGDSTGYVGAIEWLSADRALAVGGTGEYPRRERMPSTPANDIAEDGRAWLYEGGAWRELSDLPAGMRGMSALGLSPRPSDCPGATSECAAAGAFRQLWTFADGSFTGGVSDQSSDSDLDRSYLFQFRVRDVKFSVNVPDVPGQIHAVAVTSGCCAFDELRNGYRFLLYDGAQWYVRQSEGDSRNASNTFHQQAAARPPRPVGDTWQGVFEGSGTGSYEWTRDPVERGGCPHTGVWPCGKDTWEEGWSLFGTIPVIPPLEPELGPWPIEEGTVPQDPQNPAAEETDPLDDTVEREHEERYRKPNRELDRETSPYGGSTGTGHPSGLYAILAPRNECSTTCFGAIVSGVSTPSGPAPQDGPTSEPASQIVGGTVRIDRGPTGVQGLQPFAPGVGVVPGLNDKRYSTLRLHDLDTTPVRMTDGQPALGGANPTSPWIEAVGLLQRTGQGAAYGPQERFPDRSAAGLHGCDTTVTPPEDCDPDADRYIEAQGSRNIFKLPSYALNSVEVADEDTGAGWAVGDHGAILSLAGESAAQLQSQEPDPPRLGPRRPERLPDREPYEGHRKPPTDEPGIVPALADRPLERFREPRFVSGGVPDDLAQGGLAQGVGAMAISRDGSEGWAFSSFGSKSIYRLEGGEWRRCFPADPAAEEACASLAPYANLTVGVRDVERVPLERDSDPTNDEEFEAAALTNRGLLRYRKGRWQLDKEAKLGPLFDPTGPPTPLSGHDIAFVAPDDGWVVDNSSSLLEIHHFNGERWIRCAGFGADPAECGDPDGRLSDALEDLLAGNVAGERNDRRLRLAATGERVYAFGTRGVGGTGAISAEAYPMIIYRDRGGTWTGGIDETDDGIYNPIDGGWDPAYYVEGGNRERVVEPPPVHGLVDPQLNFGASKLDEAARGGDSAQGRVFTVSVAETVEGIEGWALGTFGDRDSDKAAAAMMRLEDDAWRFWSQGDAVDEHLRELRPTTALDPRSHLTLPAPTGAHSSFLFQPGKPALAFNPERERWEALATPWLATRLPGLRHMTTSSVRPAVADGRGGFWVGVEQDGICGGCGNQFAFYHHTDRTPRPVFEDVANPARNTQITAMAVAADGTLWLGDQSGALHRYDRLTGWQRNIKVPGWDPPRATSPSPIAAIALAPDGRGIAIGPGGRIADLGPEQVRLNDAAGVACRIEDPVPPCGTGRNLGLTAVAPDGSAIVSGGADALLWRPAGGEFRRIELPRLPRGTGVADVVLPRGDRAYLLTSRQQLLRGELSGGQWTWRFELGTLTGPDPIAGGLSIRDLAIDAEGRGYAVGNGGLLLRRNGDGEAPWRRIASATRDDLHAVALPAGGGDGALVGAERGVILTLAGERLAIARSADPFAPMESGVIGAASVAELALAAGTGSGQVEAWAVLKAPPSGDLRTRSPRPQALLHHTSDPADPLLDPSRGLAPLADTPPPRPGELSFAAFGKQECQTIRQGVGGFAGALNATAPCPPQNGSNLLHEEIAKRVGEELAERSERPGGPGFALFTGDASDAAGGGGESFADGFVFPGTLEARTPIDPNAKHRRWVELVADPLAGAGLPVLGAIGGQDLALHGEAGFAPYTDLYFGGNLSARQLAEGAGVRGGLLNLPWRETMGAMPAPWQRDDGDAGSIGFERVGGGALSQDVPEAETPEASAKVDPLNTGSGVTARLTRISTAGAPTHYATDVIRDGEKVARIVVVDTSLGSLAASNAGTAPIEAGGQERWLEEVLCFEGSAADLDGDVRDCTREPGQLAIVLTNTPTYSYGPIAPDETMRDAAVFEAIVLRNEVDVVVSGRLGWNGLYWATAPGVHEPCPGQPYQTEPPKPGTRVCGQGSEDLAGASEQVQGDVQELADGTPVGLLPFVVSSTAGGRFNERAERSGATSPEDGFWRGYSIVRLDASGDPRKTIVEQRAVLDWIDLTARERALLPRERTTLRGTGREPVGIDTTLRFIDIQSPAITHRYELLLADPDDPWLPCEAADPACEALYAKLAANELSIPTAGAEGSWAANPCEPYLCLPERIGTVDSQSGEVRAGNGKYPDTFAVAMLSVGDHVASYPMVFKKSPSFIVSPARGFPEIPSTPTDTGTASAPPPPPPPPTPNVPQPNAPNVPAPPPVPPIAASEPPEPQPPAPPAPPPPTEQPSPLSLTLAPPSITVATPTAVIQPPTPPVNPAPPGGARREARQRQAAAQKSGADPAEGSPEDRAGETQGAGGDMATRPMGAEMTRRDTAAQRNAATRHERSRPGPSFTPLARPEQPSASARGLLYAGGLTIAAAALALGFSGARPTPRRRPPEVPAPALARARFRR